MSKITEAQYDKICQMCDKLLSQNIRKENIITNNWLHVIRFHPIFLKDYEYIFYLNNLKFYFFLSIKYFNYLFISLYRILKIIFKKKIESTQEIKNDINKCEAIFVSHFLNNKFINNNQDFYFHQLPNKFANVHNNSLTLKINHSKTDFSILNKKSKSHNEFVLPKNLSFYEEINITLSLHKEFVTLLFKRTPKNVNYRIKLQAAIEFISPASHFNLRIGRQVGSFVKRFKPNYIFTTFEGHGFERTIYSNARKSNKSIKCVAYQHSLIFNKQHAVKRSLGANYDPDYILTSGYEGKKKLLNTGLVSKNKIFLFGTNRTASGKIFFKKKRDTFLILPEGDLVECYPLIDLTFNLVKLLPLYNFIIRFHPITDILKLKKRRVKLKNTPDNIIMSNEPFEDDLNRSDFAIYRGSTTIIKAIEKGLIPIYYHKKNGQNIDPLFSLKKFKKSIEKPSDISKVLNVSEVENVKNLNLLKGKIKSYFSPINYHEALRVKDSNK